jgi:hypothetical protein
VLIEQIQYNFRTYTPENKLELLNDGDTWTEISVQNPNVSLSDVGVKQNSLVSIKPKEEVPEPAPAPEPEQEPVPAPSDAVTTS